MRVQVEGKLNYSVYEKEGVQIRNAQIIANDLITLSGNTSDEFSSSVEAKLDRQFAKLDATNKTDW